MNKISKWAVTLALLAEAAYGQVPGSNDTSDGNYNTGMGSGALGGPAASNGGAYNTASGFYVLFSNTTGRNNTAAGSSALQLNSSGSNNTALGNTALFWNNGSGNTALGYEALFGGDQIATGGDNTATGAYALAGNTTGYYNTATGVASLAGNTTGSDNAAFGQNALQLNTTGYRNTGFGSYALQTNNGDYNNAVGYSAMAYNTTGSYNNAQGYLALENNTTGNNNIAIGQYAGYHLTTGNSNIDIGNEGVAGESGVIRIGAGATHTYISGINTSTVTGAAVYVTSSGQLGVLASSERYKTAITPMGANTEKLRRLRPVSFHLKTDPSGAVQYGLIAEEVAKVYPELVVRDQNGRIDGVRYDELAPMLLNEVQKQQKIVAAQAAKIAGEDHRAAVQDAKIAFLEQQLAGIHAALVKLQSKEELVAQR